MRDLTDEQLMIEYREGSITAFELLYERYRVALYRYFSRLCGNPTQANDLYQGSWEKVIRNRKKYPEQAPFRAWLFRVARNHYIDTLRAARPTDVLEEEPGDETNPDPGDQWDGEQRERELREALMKLSEEQRDAIVLKLDGGLDLKSIAEVTGVGMETAKSRIRYATRSLKEVFQQ